MRKFISFSGGVESTTMCILYGKGATAIWSDTGAEHEKMYDRINTVEDRLKQLHSDFEVVRLKGKAKYKGEWYHGLEDLIVAQKYMPSGQMRFCTRLFKSTIIDDYLSDKGDCELMIGFNADEEGRTGSLEQMPNVTYTYPLIEDGLSRSDCEDILRINDLHPSFPPYMRRGGCRMCFFKSEREYKAMYHLNRKEFEEVQAFEEKIQDRRAKFYSIMSNGKSLRQLSEECKQEKEFMVGADWNEIYKSIEVTTSCGAFCHR